MLSNRLFKTRILDYIDNKDKVKDEDEQPFYAQDKDEIKYYADKQNNAKPCNINIEDKDIVR